MLYIHNNYSPNWHLSCDLGKEPEIKILCSEFFFIIFFSPEYFRLVKLCSESPGNKMPAQHMYCVSHDMFLCFLSLWGQ